MTEQSAAHVRGSRPARDPYPPPAKIVPVLAAAIRRATAAARRFKTQANRV